MPDWFYRTVSRPVLFRLPPTKARGFALGLMGRLARLPLGPALIDFLGHMRPDPRLQQSHLGLTFPSAIGLGPYLDAEATALPALARFGFGFLDVGPVRVAAPESAGAVERRPATEALWYPESAAGLSLSAALPRLQEAAKLGLPILVRLAATSEATAEQATEQCRRLLRELAPHVQLFGLAADLSSEHAASQQRQLVEAAAHTVPPRPVLICVPADLDSARIELVLTAGAAGVVIDGSVTDGQGARLVGPAAFEPALRLVRELRHRADASLLVIASAGVHEPEQAVALRKAGADLVEVDSGLVYSGPGLPKRINDALLFAATKTEQRLPADQAARPVDMSWFWLALMGAGMLFGSLLALVIAATLVVMPYDEAFVGLSRHDLPKINARLLAFMAHDRVSLAGTMVSIGVLYLGLSLKGVRRGLHWAALTIFVSAFTGFASFFLFLGFGYLDPFHAFVTAILLQLLLLGVHSRPERYAPSAASLRETRAWRTGLWGQLLLILHGFGLLAAGLSISAIGATQVFVHEDLEFMQTTAEALRAAHPRLVPLVAHDRATFGGMLLACGWGFLLPALWGFRAGTAWLWWTMLVAGLAAYTPAIGVHFAVGYTDWGHLLPAFAGQALLLMGLALSHNYLCSESPGMSEPDASAKLTRTLR